MRKRKAFDFHAALLKCFALFCENDRIRIKKRKKQPDPVFHFASKVIYTLKSKHTRSTHGQIYVLIYVFLDV